MYYIMYNIIVKMIQNLESKMELQINSLETKIEKMQEMFKKDLEETIYLLMFRRVRCKPFFSQERP